MLRGRVPPIAKKIKEKGWHASAGAPLQCKATRRFLFPPLASAVSRREMPYYYGSYSPYYSSAYSYPSYYGAYSSAYAYPYSYASSYYPYSSYYGSYGAYPYSSAYYGARAYSPYYY